MIKKWTACCFILIANIALLAHAVLPHHHHQQQVCVERTHCIDDAATQTHNTPGHNHSHDSTDNTTCVINQAIITPQSQARFTPIGDNCTVNPNYHLYTHANFGYLELHTVAGIVTSVPDFPFFLAATEKSTLSLRAPPIV
jgi:hypothetical protein